MGNRSGRLVVLALAALLVLVLYGCGQEPAGTGEEVVTPPAQETETPTTEEPTTGGELDGEALAKQKCVMCHTYDRIAEASFSESEWDEVIRRMQDLGLSISGEERAAILEYLATRDQ